LLVEGSNPSRPIMKMIQRKIRGRYGTSSKRYVSIEHNSHTYSFDCSISTDFYAHSYPYYFRTSISFSLRFTSSMSGIQ